MVRSAELATVKRFGICVVCGTQILGLPPLDLALHLTLCYVAPGVARGQGTSIVTRGQGTSGKPSVGLLSTLPPHQSCSKDSLTLCQYDIYSLLSTNSYHNFVFSFCF